jgi:hypothetical protein
VWRKSVFDVCFAGNGTALTAVLFLYLDTVIGATAFCSDSSIIRVITKWPNSEKSYKGKVKTHNYINRQNQSTTGKLKTVMTSEARDHILILNILFFNKLRQIISEVRSEMLDLLIFMFILKTTGTFTPVHSAGCLILRNELRSTQEIARQNIQVSFYIRSTGLSPNTFVYIPCACLQPLGIKLSIN